MLMSDFSKNDRLIAMDTLKKEVNKNGIIIGPLHDDRSTNPLSICVLSYDVGNYDSWDEVPKKIQSILNDTKIFPTGSCRYSCQFYNDKPIRTVHSGPITIAQYGSGSSYHKTEPMTVVSREKDIWIGEEGKREAVKVNEAILVIQTRFAADIFKCLGQLSEPSA